MKKLNQSTVQLLASSQVISSIYTIIKELVENSIDAGALKIDVKLVDYGSSKIEVSDNGNGITKEDITYICLSHYTSKLSRIDDLLSLTSYGFRGEALHSLNTLASIEVTSKTKDDSVATTYSFVEDGRIDELNTKPSAACDGTSVVVTDLFKNIPVRKNYYRNEKRLKEDLKSTECLLMSYSIAHPHIRFSLVNNSFNVFLKNSCKDKKDVLRQIWGLNCLNAMQYTCVNQSERKIKVESFLPTFKNPLEKGLCSDKSFIIVNNRPVVMQDIDKLIKDKIRSVGIAQSICYCVIIDVSSDQMDVNVEPNKSKILFHKKERVFNILVDMLRKVYAIEEESGHQADNSGRQLRKTTNAKNVENELEESINGSKDVEENSMGIVTHFRKQLQRKTCSNNETSSKSVNGTRNFNNETANSEKSTLEEDLLFEKNWRRGNIRTNSNELMVPVQVLGPKCKRPLSPFKENNASKKKCLSTGHNLSRSASKLIPNKQQQPFSAYMMFAHDIRRKVIDENPACDFMQINRLIFNEWNALDGEQRDKYEQVFSRNKTRKLRIQCPAVTSCDKSVKNVQKRGKKEIRFVKINFDMEKVKTLRARLPIKPESYNLIGKLRDGFWLLNYQNCIGTWNQCRGKEMELYTNLVENHRLISKRLDLPLPLTEGLVGGEKQWLKLLSLEDKRDIGIYYYVTDARIVWNGITVRKWRDSITNLFHAEITDVTDMLAFYGINDLKEILNKMVADDDISLAQSRPLQLVNYFKGEAVRISRQIPIKMDRSQVENSIEHALKHTKYLTEFQCFHGFSIFLPFYDFGVGEFNFEDEFDV